MNAQALEAQQKAFNKRMRKRKAIALKVERTVYIPPRSHFYDATFSHYGIQSKFAKRPTALTLTWKD